MQKKHADIFERQSQYWKRCAKIFRYKDGDANTRYFHAVVNKRRRKNMIRQLQDGSRNWVRDKWGLVNLMVGYFSSLILARRGGMGVVLDWHITYQVWLLLNKIVDCCVLLRRRR